MTTTDDTAPEPATEPEPTVELAPADDAPAAEAGGNAEAAKYRVRLRETEAERDRLSSLVAGYRTSEVERAVAELPNTLGDPHDLWVDGTVLDDLLADDGTIDTAKVEAAVARVLASHPAWAKQEPFIDLVQGTRSITPAAPSIGDAVRNAVRQR